MDTFTWEKTPQKVKDYFVGLLGRDKAKKLMKAMSRREWIIIDGPHGPTGKTTLADVLRAIGYSKVVEANHATSIQVSEVFSALRKKDDIFESLGISAKC